MDRTMFLTAQPQKLSTMAILRVILTLFWVLTKRVVRVIIKSISATRVWLNAKHTFFDDADNEPITCTGWQFVGIGFLACLLTFILGIDYASLFF